MARAAGPRAAVDLEAELDALHALPPREFTKARGALARKLREAGRAEPARRVAALRKAPPSAWALNALWRHDRPSLEQLRASGRKARQAQADVLAGRDAIDALRAAAAREQSLREGLVDRASEHLAGAGLSAARAVRDRMAENLRAISYGDGWDALSGGRLTEDLEPPGLDVLGGADVSPRRRDDSRLHPSRTRAERATRPALQKTRKPDRVGRAKASVDATEREARGRAAKARLEAARAARRDADSEAARIERTARRLSAEADRADDAARSAEADAARAREAARRAAEALATAVDAAQAAAEAESGAEASLLAARGAGKSGAGGSLPRQRRRT